MKALIKIALVALLISMPSPAAPGGSTNKRPAKITVSGPGDVPDDVGPPDAIKRKPQGPRIKISTKRFG